MSKISVQNGAISLLYTVWIVGGMLLVPTTITAIFEQVGLTESQSEWLSSSVGTAVYSVVVYSLSIVIIMLPFLLAKGVTFSGLLERLRCNKGLSWRMVRWAIAAWLVYFVVNALVMAVLLHLNIPGIDLTQAQNVGFSSPGAWYDYVLSFLVLVVVAPLAEEVIFRGFLYSGIRKRGSFIFAALLTSIAFAFLHGQVNVGIDVFILSMFLCYLREKFDSIWPGVLVHALKNGLAYTVLFILPLYGVRLI